MSSSGYDDDNDAPRPKRSGGPPTWLIILLSILLVMGLICVGGVALLVFGVKTSIQGSQAEWVKSEMEQVHSMVVGYQAENGVYPTSLKQAYSNSPGGANTTLYDLRDSKQQSFVYLVPASNAQPGDILAHTSRTGPLPIIAVHLDGKVEEYATAMALDQALLTQRNRPPPPDQPPGSPGQTVPGGPNAVPLQGEPGTPVPPPILTPSTTEDNNY